MSSSNFSIVAFGLTGFGNDLLIALQGLDFIDVKCCYTREERGDFPHYQCDPIRKTALDFNISLLPIDHHGSWRCESADVAIISSFHRKLQPEHLAQYKVVINVHPSILPKYKGPTPIPHMILNRETEFGLTAHIVTEIIDAGPIIHQMIFSYQGETAGELRQKLSHLSVKFIEDTLNQYPDFKKTEQSKNSNETSYFERITEDDGVFTIEELQSLIDLDKAYKAFTPWPGIKIKLENGEILNLIKDNEV